MGIYRLYDWLFTGPHGICGPFKTSKTSSVIESVWSDFLVESLETLKVLELTTSQKWISMKGELVERVTLEKMIDSFVNIF